VVVILMISRLRDIVSEAQNHALIHLEFLAVFGRKEAEPTRLQSVRQCLQVV
jgi:hypothetical protein